MTDEEMDEVLRQRAEMSSDQHFSEVFGSGLQSVVRDLQRFLEQHHRDSREYYELLMDIATKVQVFRLETAHVLLDKHRLHRRNDDEFMQLLGFLDTDLKTLAKLVLEDLGQIGSD